MISGMTTDWCFKCKKYKSGSYLCNICGITIDGEREYFEPKPQTNYDRIISKTPEELAEFFGTLPCCPPGSAEELCYPENTCGADTKMMVKCWGTWLKSPVEEGDNET